MKKKKEKESFFEKYLITFFWGIFLLSSLIGVIFGHVADKPKNNFDHKYKEAVLIFDHIEESEELGGENGVSNYALLTVKSHKLMHLLEEKDPELFEEINAKFLELNRSLKPPTKEYYRSIDSLLRKNKKLTQSKGRKK